MLRALLACFVATSVAAQWENKNVDRKIDATTQIVRTITSATLTNIGSSANSEVEWIIPESNLTKIAKMVAKVDKTVVALTETKRQDGNVFYKVSLNKPVSAGESVTIKMRCSVGEALRALPATIRQGESQMVDFNENAYFLSPYKTLKQSTVFKMPTAKVESFSDTPAPVTHNKDSIVFGEYRDIAPMSAAPLRVHFTNNKPYIVAPTLKRVLEVSMWGNLAVEEWYTIEHRGAKLKGSFSRLEYGKHPGAAPASFNSLHATLPAKADDIYFRDDIGNISTSRIMPVDRDTKTKEVIFQQRFPLFGGWKTRFYYGYNLALENVLHKTPEGLNRLKVPYASPMKDIIVEDMVVEIVLPEGVPAPEVKVGGKKIDDYDIEIRATYLDVTGRTVVVLKDKMIASPERNEELEVTFKFTTADLIWEPLYLITAFMCLFCSVIFLGRLVS
eukprot:TRINITY_DN13026_c0_g1_i1.p1 TRINITY_DN13026_c0_g1~~TRINITY_DN13026_c0_g1_i1.p1  ORF type:complete len:459 (+),score=96.95 TRINITY_DN13026_c0_g1_i1:41-1378(+)